MGRPGGSKLRVPLEALLVTSIAIEVYDSEG
jgi:hypothetical protein